MKMKERVSKWERPSQRSYTTETELSGASFSSPSPERMWLYGWQQLVFYIRQKRTTVTSAPIRNLKLSMSILAPMLTLPLSEPIFHPLTALIWSHLTLVFIVIFGCISIFNFAISVILIVFVSFTMQYRPQSREWFYSLFSIAIDTRLHFQFELFKRSKPISATSAFYSKDQRSSK